MHITTQVITGLTLAAVASASVTFPYSFPNSCIASCSMEAGKKCWSDYTHDQSSPYFIESLSCPCGTGSKSTQYNNEMTNCMSNNDCGWWDTLTYNWDKSSVCDWYNEHKDMIKSHVSTTTHKSTKRLTSRSSQHKTFSKSTDSYSSVQSVSSQNVTTLPKSHSFAGTSAKVSNKVKTALHSKNYTTLVIPSSIRGSATEDQQHTKSHDDNGTAVSHNSIATTSHKYSSAAISSPQSLSMSSKTKEIKLSKSTASHATHLSTESTESKTQYHTKSHSESELSLSDHSAITTASDPSSVSFETSKVPTTTEAQSTWIPRPSNYFPFPPPNKCMTDCSFKAGRKCWSKYTQDIHSPYFVESLSCLCDSSNPGHSQFISDSASCMISSDCGFFAMIKAEGQQSAICKWYNEHKQVIKPTESHSTTETHKASAPSVHSESTESSTAHSSTYDVTSQESSKSTQSPKAFMTTMSHNPSHTLKSESSSVETTKSKSNTTASQSSSKPVKSSEPKSQVSVDISRSDKYTSSRAASSAESTESMTQHYTESHSESEFSVSHSSAITSTSHLSSVSSETSKVPTSTEAQPTWIPRPSNYFPFPPPNKFLTS
ncbi:hypothetical protein K7432_013108 [Basidiobolus ranarum]|uniref:Extracellular membrane protein CFEM domain-containing protein n=1 Tax=Basidiobolus ranarum TaxID=34480 RepID=A0ABR2VR93_9FUNG